MGGLGSRLRHDSSHADNVDFPDDDSDYDDLSENECGDAEEREDVNPEWVVTKSVCRLKERSCGFTLPGDHKPHHYHGTGFLGFFYLDANTRIYGLFTANHVLETKFMEFILPHDQQHSIRLTFDYIKGKRERDYLLRPKGIIFACPVLDLTFIQILGEELAELTNEYKREFLPLRREVVRLSRRDELTIVQHPCDDQMKTATNKYHNSYGLNIAHHVSTAKGSSGSPVLFDGRVVGVHKGVLPKLSYNVAVSTQSVVEGIVTAYIKNANSRQLIGPPNYSIPRELKLQRECKSFRIYVIHFKDGKIGYCTPTSYMWYWTLTNPGYHRYNPKGLHEIDWFPMNDNLRNLDRKDYELIRNYT